MDRLLKRRAVNSGPIGYKPEAPLRDFYYEQMMSAFLIELTMSDTDSRFLIHEFGQPGSEQAAHMMKCLSEDGTAVVWDEDAWPSEPMPAGEVRLAFFLHYFDPSKPLNTSYGELAVPPPVEMPERLRRLFRYEPVT